MKTFTFIFVFALLFFFFPRLSVASEECSGWANFAKIMTNRARDDGKELEFVKARLAAEMAGADEIDTAMDWIAFVYAHPNIEYPNMWQAVYDECTLQQEKRHVPTKTNG